LVGFLGLFLLFFLFFPCLEWSHPHLIALLPRIGWLTPKSLSPVSSWPVLHRHGVYWISHRQTGDVKNLIHHLPP
jgi:hypothetical protein